jgi:hypothetical protein
MSILRREGMPFAGLCCAAALCGTVIMMLGLRNVKCHPAQCGGLEQEDKMTAMASIGFIAQRRESRADKYVAYDVGPRK